VIVAMLMKKILDANDCGKSSWVNREHTFQIKVLLESTFALGPRLGGHQEKKFWGSKKAKNKGW